MTEPVTSVIVARSMGAERLRPMVVWSVVAHAALIVLAVLIPAFGGPEPPRVRMTIVLNAGGGGPDTGGLTPISSRAVQQAAPAEAPRIVPPAPAPEPPKVPEPEPAPRPKPEPAKVAAREPPKPAASPPVAPETATARKPSTGEEVQEGNARVETGAPPRTRGSGLSSGGSQSAGASSVQTDEDFCCLDYLQRMANQIEHNWDQHQGRSGVTVVKFTIHRDGMIQDVSVDRPSGAPALDRAAQRAVAITRQLPRLPSEYPNPTLTVRLTFEY